MNRELRIVFMGTPDFAVETLKYILDSHYKVVGVVTAPDRPAGRGRKLQQSAVKKFAIEKGLEVLQPTNLKEEEFIKSLGALQANLQVVVAFRMLPKVVWDMPDFGTFNLHASLLPAYRGAAPINWALINGEKQTGVTTFFIDDKIDTGEIIAQRNISIGADENAGHLHDRLMVEGADLVVETLELIADDKANTTKQPHLEVEKTAYKLNKDNTKINWNAPSKDIHNLIRGLSPYPSAWTILDNGDNDQVNIKIYDSHVELKEHSLTPGEVFIEDKQLKVASSDGFVVLNEIQLAGKRRMAIKDVLNGFSFNSEAKMR
ncbi:MAG TPA: methionyl-tRNA formyltransferase [Sphingobacteriaceae bacterium]|nr:methionyl-tRNA formyltransferase [Sphingobacteriaceae bacterium]